MPYFITDSAGSVAGSEGAQGRSAGTSASVGNVIGFEGAGGAVAGTSDSQGSATGTGSTPAPPAPSGGRYRPFIVKQAAPVAAFGAATGSNASVGRIQGSTARIGAVVGNGMSAGIVRGLSRLSVAPIRYIEDTEHRRRRREDELLTLELI